MGTCHWMLPLPVSYLVSLRRSRDQDRRVDRRHRVDRAGLSSCHWAEPSGIENARTSRSLRATTEPPTIRASTSRVAGSSVAAGAGSPSGLKSERRVRLREPGRVACFRLDRGSRTTEGRSLRDDQVRRGGGRGLGRLRESSAHLKALTTLPDRLMARIAEPRPMNAVVEFSAMPVTRRGRGSDRSPWPQGPTGGRGTVCLPFAEVVEVEPRPVGNEHAVAPQPHRRVRRDELLRRPELLAGRRQRDDPAVLVLQRHDHAARRDQDALSAREILRLVTDRAGARTRCPEDVAGGSPACLAWPAVMIRRSDRV